MNDMTSLVKPSAPFICPICGGALTISSNVAVCSARHSFDIAREGYANLLPAGNKRKGIEGDTAEMLKARRQFLDAGYYQPLLLLLTTKTTELTRQFVSKVGKNVNAVVFESGCGEGYFIGNIDKTLKESGYEGVSTAGMDISKHAAKLAAKRYPGVFFFVSDVGLRVPLRDSSVHFLLNIFSPRNVSEFARIVANGGFVVVVIPGRDHLADLRKRFALLDVEEDKEQRIRESFGDTFECVERRELGFTLQLGSDAVSALIRMGPSVRHMKEFPNLSSTEITEVHTSFLVLTFRKA